MNEQQYPQLGVDVCYLKAFSISLSEFVFANTRTHTIHNIGD